MNKDAPETNPEPSKPSEPSAGEKMAAAIQEKLGIAINPADVAGGKFPLALILGLADRAQKLEEETKVRIDGILQNEVTLGKKLDELRGTMDWVTNSLTRIGQYEQAIAKKLGADVPPPK
jgi:hypothetical protein